MGLLDNFMGEDQNPAGLLSLALLNATGNKNAAKKMMAIQMMGQMDNNPDANGANAQSGEINPNYQLPTFKSSETVYNSNTPSYSSYTNAVSQSSLPQDKQQLLTQLKQNAEMAYPGNKIMQEVAITQAIHESNLMGKPSQLARNYNNYFGIKAPGTAGTVNMRTGEVLGGRNVNVNAGFGRNNSPLDSFIQHRNLMNKSRYAPVVSSGNPYDAFNALQKSGYATDPQYAKKLGSIFQRYVDPLI